MVTRVMGAAVHTDEALLACLPLISCGVARLLTGQGPVPARDLEAGDSCLRGHALQNLSIQVRQTKPH